MRLGALSIFHINTGTYDAPTWSPVQLISDLNVTPGWDEDESSTRTSRVKTFEQTMMGIEITGKIRKEILNVPFLAMRTAFNAGSPIDVLVLDGSTAQVGSEGYRFVARVFQFGEDQSLGKVIFKDFSVKPCVGYNNAGTETPPKAAIVTAPDTVVFSAIGA